MSSDSADAIQRWAAAHAATVPWGSAARQSTETEAVRAQAPAVPAVLASCTETGTFSIGRTGTAVAMGRGADSRLVVAAGGSASPWVRIWDPGTGLIDRTMTGHTSQIYGASWGQLADGRPVLATSSDDGTVRIWDTGTGETLRVLTGHRGLVYCADWGYQPGRQPLLATAGQADGTVRIWDTDTGATLRTIELDGGSVWSVAWVRRTDGQLLLTICCETGPVRIWDPDTGRLLSLGEDSRARSVSCGHLPDGRPVLATAFNGTASVWREDDGGFAGEILSSTPSSMREVRWAPITDGRMLLAISSDDALQIWDGHALACVYSEELNFRDTGLHHLDWALEPDGRLLLAAASYGGQVHLWDVVLDPPVRRDGAALPEPARILSPPEDVTPGFQPVTSQQPSIQVCCAASAEGRLLLATRNSDGLGRIWDASTGTMLHQLAGQGAGGITRFAWGRLRDGRLVLATVNSRDDTVRIWDSGTGELVYRHEGVHQGGVRCVTWIHGPDGQPLLATGGSFDGAVRVWDPATGEQSRVLAGHESFVSPIAEGWLADGRHCLAVGSSRDPLRLWDLATGDSLCQFTVAGVAQTANRPWSVAWGHGPDGRPRLAVGTGDGTVRIWDPATGELLRTLTGLDRDVNSLVWANQPGWPSVLVGDSADGTARIWDPDTGDELARLPSASQYGQAIDLVEGMDGSLLLAIAAGHISDDPSPARLWRIATGSDTGHGTARHPGRPARMTAHHAAELTSWLLRLGNGALWIPVGLVADLVELTAPDGSGPLEALSAEPGVPLLRDLGWSPAARVAFAGLLASGLVLPEQYAPPAGATVMELRDALGGALAAESDDGGAFTAYPVPVSALRTAMAGITDRTITLLRILGPVACAADPLLPVRLAHRIPQLPALSPRELRVLAPDGTSPLADSRAAATETQRYTPGTVGLARTGPLTRLLPTQLALPRDVMTMRLAENQLLYRQHRAPAPPALEPVTIILDTTPPTYGPAGQALRLAAHLLTVILWEHGRRPCLITLTSPDTVTELRSPADLVDLWTSATLGDTAPALAIAVRTAVATGQPTVLCTHHHSPREIYAPGPATRLLTSHQPPEQAPPGPVNPWHAHVGPRPAYTELTGAIARLLTERADAIG